MTGQQHPITPPEELVQQWASESLATQSLCAKAACWGADQELEACLEWHRNRGYSRFISLREDRRPKPPSLKAQALEELNKWREVIGVPQLDIIRNALEQIND